MRIVGWYKMGWTADEIVANYEGHLDVAQILHTTPEISFNSTRNP